MIHIIPTFSLAYSFCGQTLLMRLVEWIKALLGVPFIIHSQPTGVFDTQEPSVARMAAETHRRYSETFKDVEQMIDDHS